MNFIERGLDQNFYVTGGTLRRDAPCYVQRQADEELLQALQQGQFCYVLTARQIGKSSLMVQTAARLRETGCGVAILDLTAIGNNLTIEQWYGGLLSLIGQQLDLEDELLDFYARRALLSPLQTWMRAIREIVLPRYFDRVIFFVDEIDAVHNLPFSTDEFFAGIRKFYNGRTEDEELEKLTFCLLGVATPSDLIGDARTTPFNIGQRIELHDFTAEEAVALERGLARQPVVAQTLMQRVLYWTNGHPYLTQRLCQAIARDAAAQQIQDVDQHCEQLFLSHRALERDDNLLFVRERILQSEVERADVLDLYTRLLYRKHVADDETNALVSVLRLSGIAKVAAGKLQIRNRIYEHVFDRQWVKNNLPDAEWQRQRRAYWRGVLRATAVSAVILLAILTLTFIAFRQRNEAEAQRKANRQLLYAAEMNVVGQAWESANVARVRELLQKHIPTNGQEDLRGFEWSYYWRLSQQQQRTFHFDSLVQSVAYAPDGKWLAVGLDDGAVKIINIATGQTTATLRAHTDRVYAVAIAPNGKYLASASFDKTVKIWEAASGRELNTLTGFQERVAAVAISPDSQVIASGDLGGAVKIWAATNNKLITTFTTKDDRVNFVAFSPDGKKLATAWQDRNVKVYDLGTKKMVHTLKHEAEVTTVAFSPDGKTIATGCLHTAEAKLWDAQTGEIKNTLRGHKGAVWCVAFAPDGKTLATSGDDSVTRLWQVETGKEITTFIGHGLYIFSVAFAPDGKTLATASWDQTVKLWTVNQETSEEKLSGHKDWVKAIAFAPDGKTLVSASDDKRALVWDIATHQPLHVLFKHQKSLANIAFSPDGKFIATGSEDKTIMLWAAQTGQLIRTLQEHESEIRALAFSPDTKMLATGDAKGIVKIWDINTGQQLHTIPAYKYNIFALTFSPDGTKLIIGGGYDKIKIFAAHTGQEISALDFSPQIGRFMIFSPDGRWLAAEYGGTSVGLFDPTTGKMLRDFRGHTARITSLSFTPDGKRLATSSVDGTVKIWDVNSGLELTTIHTHTSKAFAVAFAPDGKTLAVACGDYSIKLWRAND